MLRERNVKAGTTGGANTRVYFFLTDATDYVTPETGEAGGQPQISTNGGAWTNTGIGTLTSIGNGSYYADLTTSAVATAGAIVLTRYKSSNTSEARGTSVIVTVYAPASETQTVSLGASTIGTSQLVDGAFTAAKFAANAITSTVVADGTITAAKIGADAITNAKIADNAIAAENIATGAIAGAKIDAAALDASKFDEDVNTYTLNARLTQVDGSNQRYVLWVTKNGGASVASASYTGTPTITAVKASDGSTLISAQNLTAFGTTGSYRYAASGGSLLAAGEDVDVVMTATIDGTARTLKAVASKQYTA